MHLGGIEQAAVVSPFKHQLAALDHRVHRQLEGLAVAVVEETARLESRERQRVILRPRIEIEHHAQQRRPRTLRAAIDRFD